MGTSYKAFDFVNSGQGKLGGNLQANANDLTIKFSQRVKVVGVNGIAPSDPNAPYTLEGDGDPAIKISDIAQVGPNGTVKVRVMAPDGTKVTRVLTFWTLDGNRISDEAMLLSLADSIEQDPTTGPGSASALSLAEISDKLDRLYVRLGERTPLG